jgi:hypothetical protein
MSAGFLNFLAKYGREQTPIPAACRPFFWRAQASVAGIGTRQRQPPTRFEICGSPAVAHGRASPGSLASFGGTTMERAR